MSPTRLSIAHVSQCKSCRMYFGRPSSGNGKCPHCGRLSMKPLDPDARTRILSKYELICTDCGRLRPSSRMADTTCRVCGTGIHDRLFGPRS